MLILKLLQLALGTRTSLSRKPTAAEWQQLYQQAEEHSVIGLVFGGVEHLPKDYLPDMDQLMDWLGQTEYLKIQKINYDIVLANFDKCLRANNIPYVLFKGAATASFYPNPFLRSMGDVDFYVPPSEFNRSLDVLESELNVVIKKDNIDKHYSFIWREFPFEIHFQMETFGYKTYQEYYANLCDSCFDLNNLSMFQVGSSNISVQLPMLPPLLDLIHVFKHWFTHLIGEGVGLRQTTDIAVLINVYRNKINITELKKHLNNIGYLKAFDAVVALVEKYYSILWPEYWISDKNKNQLSYEDAVLYADKLMKDVVKNGNFGRGDYKYKNGWRKRLETTSRFFNHCWRYYRLAPKDIRHLIPKRIAISMKSH